MTALIWLAGYFAAGLAVMAAVVWLHPDWYDDAEISHYDLTDGTTRMSFTVLLWPLGLPLLAIERLGAVVLRSKKNDLRILAELEKELAAAHKELDAFLRSTK